MRAFIEEKIRKILKKAYLSPKEVKISENWQREVIEDIRKIGILSKTSNIWYFEQFFWKFVPIACVIVAILLILTIKTSSIPTFEIIGDFLSFTILQTL